jgi:hypothetical protein
MSEIVASRILASMFIGRYSQADNGSQIGHRLPNSRSYSGGWTLLQVQEGVWFEVRELHAREKVKRFVA